MSTPRGPAAQPQAQPRRQQQQQQQQRVAVVVSLLLLGAYSLWSLTTRPRLRPNYNYVVSRKPPLPDEISVVKQQQRQQPQEQEEAPVHDHTDFAVATPHRPDSTPSSPPQPPVRQWQRDPECKALEPYAAMHRRAMDTWDRRNGSFGPGDQALVYVGYPPPMYKGRQTGIADRFTGLMTLFALSVATDTVFLVDWPQLEQSLDPTPPYPNLFVDVDHFSPEHASEYYQSLYKADFNSKEIKSLPYFFRYPVQYGVTGQVAARLLDRDASATHHSVYFGRAVHGSITASMYGAFLNPKHAARLGKGGSGSGSRPAAGGHHFV